MNSMTRQSLKMSLFATLLIPAMSAMAGRVTTMENRDESQQQRIEHGLQSGQIDGREASQLERGEAHVDRLEADAMRNGNVSHGEAKAIDHAQDRQSREIRSQANDRQYGNPDSRSSQRLQRDVQRNVRQEDRIGDGSREGQLTTREASRLEYGQSRSDNAEAGAAANGNVISREQSHLNLGDDHQSQQIYQQRHDYQQRDGWYYRWW